MIQTINVSNIISHHLYVLVSVCRCMGRSWEGTV